MFTHSTIIAISKEINKYTYLSKDTLWMLNFFTRNYFCSLCLSLGQWKWARQELPRMLFFLWHHKIINQKPKCIFYNKDKMLLTKLIQLSLVVWVTCLHIKGSRFNTPKPQTIFFLCKHSINITLHIPFHQSSAIMM